ncbi:MAG: hypothetical protein IJM15_00855 [Erysipelotrichaceae bacterium]|nr:hypothetical protein [Erysipelotrichaceae bacterium]
MGKKRYADLSITNISSERLGLNKIAVETRYIDETKPDRVTYIDLSRVTSDPDLDKYSLLYDLTPIWERAQRDGILAVRFYLVDEELNPLTGESVYMTPADTAEVDEATYEIVEGADGIWTKGSGEDYLLKVERSRFDEICFDHFISVSIDGMTLTPDVDYTAERGSTVITLKKSYLQTLRDAEHEVVISFDDGEVSTTLRIQTVNIPDTSDETAMSLWQLVMLAALGGLLIVRERRRVLN